MAVSLDSWNYRIVRQSSAGEYVYAIHEVFYDKAGKPQNVTEEEISPHGNSLAEFLQDFDHYERARKLPVLDYETLKEVTA